MTTSTTSLPKITLAAVPEQVNIPILLCLERGLFAKHGIEVEHKVVPEGTGVMIEHLENGTADVALTVTDGFIAGKAKGKNIQLIGTYVDSPLIWTIAGSNQFATFADLLKNKETINVGISRLGSGSHTMAHYLSTLHQFDSKRLQFVVLNNFKGLRDGITNGSIDMFLWETFTTKPYFDTNELHKLGDVETPWTAFSFVAANQRSNSDNGGDAFADVVRNRLFPALQEGVELFLQESLNKDTGVVDGTTTTIQRICRDHGHTVDDAIAWLKSVRYATATTTTAKPFSVDESRTQRSLEILQSTGLVPSTYVVTQLYGDNNNIISLPSWHE